MFYTEIVNKKSTSSGSENKHTAYDLAQMQSLPLEAKIIKTKQRIREWYDYWEGNVYVSFSGGKDSTVLLHITRQIYPNVKAVFIDTGLEYPEVREFVKTVQNVEWIRPEMVFRHVIQTYGYPLISKEVAQKIYEARRCPAGVCARRFNPNDEYATKYGGRFSMVRWRKLKDSKIPISHKCCDIMKKKPAKRFEKATGLKPITGSMASESQMRKTSWLRYGCNSFEGNRQISHPMSFWTEQDVLKYIKSFNISIPPVYGEIVKDSKGKLRTTGCDRTGCIFCAFGAHLEKEPNRFQRLKQTHPQLHKYCMKSWDEGGLGMKKVLEYCNIKTGCEEDE